MTRRRERLLDALAVVLCHLVSHISLIVSLSVAEQVLDRLMRFWRTETGTYVLATALAVHVLNALWSIYIRRYLRLSLWELAQLSLSLSIPPLFMLHVTSTKIAALMLKLLTFAPTGAIVAAPTCSLPLPSPLRLTAWSHSFRRG